MLTFAAMKRHLHNHSDGTRRPRPATAGDSVRPKKNLGQHFLTDLTIAERIADTIPVGRTLEVGPGMGVLTQYLLDKGHDLRVVELDPESVSYLKVNYPVRLDRRILQADFLRLDLAETFGGQTFSLIGNYPYNISSQIFFRVVDHRDLIPLCSGMIQKEVAERLAARPGSKAYGVLSILIQVWYDVEYLFTVGNEVFNPPPKVQSAVIRMTRNARTEADLPCSERDLRAVVKAAFSMRRKTMRNALRPLVTLWQPERVDEILQDKLFDLRAEQLPIDGFIDLTVRLRQGQN